MIKLINGHGKEVLVNPDHIQNVMPMEAKGLPEAVRINMLDGQYIVADSDLDTIEEMLRVYHRGEYDTTY